VFSETSLLGDCGILARGKAGTVIPFDGGISPLPLAENELLRRRGDGLKND
jgi:hypothetical protein